jgi:hypothetical protein
MSITTSTYHDLEAIVLANNEVEVVILTAVGPRIISYRLLQNKNILGEHWDAGIDTPLGRWKPYGGHRLWAAPESMPETYYPDNSPVAVEIESDYSLRLTSEVERGTALQKELRVTLDTEGSRLSIEHLITNCGTSEKELAPWSLTIMRGSGSAILPQEPYRSHSEALLPSRPLVLWYFTDLTDSRYSIGKEMIELAIDPKKGDPQKIGILNKQGWAAFESEGELFSKEFTYDADALYPDYGSNNEVYTAGDFMEIESLGPMTLLNPGESVTHHETWHLRPTPDLPTAAAEKRAAIEHLL